MDDAQATDPRVPPHVARFRAIRPKLTAGEIAHLRRLLGPAPHLLAGDRPGGSCAADEALRNAA